MADNSTTRPFQPGQDPNQTRQQRQQEFVDYGNGGKRFKNVDSPEGEFELKGKKSTQLKSTRALNPNSAKNVTQSIMNEYAFISYGGEYLTPGNGGILNMFADSSTQPGIVAPHEMWKNPTAKNIIEWSRALSGASAYKTALDNYNKAQVDSSGKDSDGNVIEKPELGNFSTSFTEVLEKSKAQQNAAKNMNEFLENMPSGIGNLKYEWKDFAYLKHFGQIPNNRLITLRRYKLPTLDSGAVLGRNTLIADMESYGFPKEDYLTSDSARALTYFGDGTENSINDFVGFSWQMNWEHYFSGAGKENPEINKTGILSSGAGSTGETGKIGGFFDTLNVAKILGAGGDSTAFNRALSISGLESQVNAGQYDTKTDFVLKNKKEFDEYSNGWMYRIYGPVNVITRTSRRRRGLSFNGIDITVNFYYNVHQVNTTNPKLAMLDIISNLLALTYADGTFYGGDWRFQREPTELPVPLALEEHIRRLMAGDDVSYEGIANSFEAMMQGRDYRPGETGLPEYAETIINTIKEGTVLGVEAFGDLISGLGALSAEDAASILGVTPGADGSVTVNSKDDDGKPVTNTYSDIWSYMNKTMGKDMDSMKQRMQMYSTSVMNFLKKNGGKIDDLSKVGEANALKATVHSLFGIGSTIQSISDNIISLKPMITGEPIGEWHLTVGNPMNPAMMIGNLICTNCKISFNENLGPDDFPTELKATITLKHARDRDKGDIESMFNFGQGRFYANVEDKPSPWNTGYSSRSSVNDLGTGADGSEIDPEKSSSKNENGGAPLTSTATEDYNVNLERGAKAADENIQRLNDDLQNQIDESLNSVVIDIPEDPIFDANTQQEAKAQTKSKNN